MKRAPIEGIFVAPCYEFAVDSLWLRRMEASQKRCVRSSRTISLNETFSQLSVSRNQNDSNHEREHRFALESVPTTWFGLNHRLLKSRNSTSGRNQVENSGGDSDPDAKLARRSQSIEAAQLDIVPLLRR
jgi:hypothetical protein